MAQYKVPQDVEADDKLLGPFSFRQFVYLLISGGLIALAVGLFQIFPLLAIIPLPPVLLFVALALPLKKDQPMETYLAAIVSYYLKPHNRIWTPGQRESTIKITAPKIAEDSRTRNITGEEATHRLSFLANIVDTGGYAIKGVSASPMRDDLVAEANATVDMFETAHFDNLDNTIAREENERHNEVVESMKNAIAKNENLSAAGIKTQSSLYRKIDEEVEKEKSLLDSATVVMPGSVDAGKQKKETEEPELALRAEMESELESESKSGSEPESKPEQNTENTQTLAKPSIMELASNPDFSVATIAKEANRIKERDEGEVFISLH